MWNLDLENIEELKPTMKRLFEKKEMLDNLRPLPYIALSKIKESLSIEWTYNSNSIEGNTLTLQETNIVLQDGLTVHGKSLREHFETHNHDKAIKFLYSIVNSNKNITASEILDMHKIVLNSIEDDYAGRLRNGGVRISGANFVPPNARQVSPFFDELLDFVNTNPLHLNIIEMAAVFHHKFVWIHPFFDGNGRTVRLAMNLLLIRQGFPPAIILKTDRKKYYDALNTANNGNYSKLLLLVCQALERTLNIYLNAMPDSEDEYFTISNIVMEPDIKYGQEYISLLARQGKIDAYKEGKDWLTSKKAIVNYMANRKRIR